LDFFGHAMTGSQNIIRRRWMLILLASVVIGIGFAAATSRVAVLPPPQLSDAKSALLQGDYDRAERLANQLVLLGLNQIQALAVAGEAAGKAGRIDAAVQYYETLSKRQQQFKQPPVGLYYAAEACRDAGRLTEAQVFYQRFLTFSPDHVLTHERLAFLMNVSGSRRESVPHFFSLVRSGKAEVQELVLFADLDRPNEQHQFLNDCEKKSPGDQFVQFGLAADALWEGRVDEATSRLKKSLSTFPNFIAGQAMLGELLVNDSDDQFVKWYLGLPSTRDPDIQYVLGLWCRKHHQTQMAARCFWNSLRDLPTSRRATAQLGQQLRLLGDKNVEFIEKRSKQQTELTQLIDQVLRTNSERVEPIRDAALLLEQMGRLWEAAAWGLVAERQFPDATWPRELFTRVAGMLDEKLPLVIDPENLALRFDLSAFPKFDLDLIPYQSSTNLDANKHSLIRFEESGCGPDFTYYNASDPSTPGARMFEQGGGGVAVIDYDRDNWPDLFFPQGSIWRTGQSEPEPSASLTDRLFRNILGNEAPDVTQSSGLVDRGFGQGAAVGDFDNDGFPDLYVGNIGRNQLLRNNGDGTFSDVTDLAGLTSTDWTSSCVVVDLNADGHADLYDVNYLTGPHVYEMICQGRACSPKAFEGTPDRLLLSRGDGTYEMVTPDPRETKGKGLGIVAFQLIERGRPSLFISNDQVPNFLLHNHATTDPSNIRLEDEAFVRGVAYNQDGLAMASMGIAADDLDGDGRIDFYVTTFKDESSMLFLQDSPGLFIDSSTTAGLRAATMPFVGWGTQCLDSDRDGFPDLVGVNGHIDDFRDEGGEFHMRPQFFRNLGTGRFSELMAAEAGSFFSQKRLGRGLSRLDWNRDGLMDFAVSNVGDRASLVMNVTKGAGHFLSVRLAARHGGRDAIGSLIEVRTSDRTWKKQLVAGDGYMASNERLVQFGLGDATTVEELIVHWPSGTKTTLRQLPADVTIELIESTPRGIQRRGPEESEVVEVITGRDD
jgi:tetratricopeptide (TPR) repeat protein